MKKMSKGMLMTALICGAVYLVGSTPVYANELQEFALDEYVVTAARTETKLVDTPANISVVDAQTIEERHYQDVSEVLKDVPGANVLDTGNGAFEKKIMLNGDERVLILVDGRRMNFDMGTMSRSGFDMNQLPDVGLIERIEVLKGAGGALYGSDAVGGVVNIITKKADRSYGKVSVSMGSMGAKDYNAMYSTKEGKTGVTISASKYEQDYYKFRDAKTDKTNRWPDKSDFKNQKISLKLDHDTSETSNLEIGYDYSKFEGHNPNDALSVGSSSPVNKSTKNLFARYNWFLKDNQDGYLQIYHNEYEYFNYGNSEEKTNGIDIQQSINLSETNKLIIGSSWRESDVKVEASSYDDGIENIAFFLNDNWEFVPSWILNIGVRYDDHSEAGDETTFSAGFNKKFNDESHAYINWGQVFRTPTTDDLFRYEDWSVNQDKSYGYFGNPNLKPETGDTWTIGYSTKLNNKTNFDINYFESDLEDAIDWDGSWTDYKPIYARNIKEQKRRGLEASIAHQLTDNLDLTASYTYIRVKNNDNGAGFVRDSHYHPNTYRLGINYHEGKLNANAWLRYGSGCDTNIEDDGFGTIKGDYANSSYVTVDLAVTYKATKDLSIYAKGYNLFNEAYAEQAGTTNGSYNYPAQSRRFIVGAEYKF